MRSDTGAGGVSVEVNDPALEESARKAAQQAVADDVPRALAAKTPTLWGPDAEPEATRRLGWLDLPTSSRALLPRLAELRDAVRASGTERVVLAGMGGSSLAPEVIARTAGVELVVLDTTDPHQVRRVLSDRLDRTVVVVSSKSGTTLETDSHRRIFEQAFRGAGLARDLASRFVVVTDPATPLERYADDAGYPVVRAAPDVGGRYSALSAFGLVPTALAGLDVQRLLDEAAAVAPALAGASDNPGLALGAALGAGALAGRDKVVLADHGSGISGFGDWAEQLLAESTGKQGRGLLPVVVESVDAPGYTQTGPAAGDTHLVALGGPAGPATTVAGPLGAQFLVWEYATALAGRVMGINPFDQPNVQESKDNTNTLLDRAGDGPLPGSEPAFMDGAVEVHADDAVVRGARTLGDVITSVLQAVPPDGYLAVMAYLDRVGDAGAARLRPALAARSDRPVTFGWGPRFLHSTGQYHKGGPRRGVFLQVTGAVREDVEVPGRPFTLGRLQQAQALGDLDALARRGRPAIRLHLRDRAEGMERLLAAAEGPTR